MNKKTLTSIIKFVESEIKGYDIEFDYRIEEEIVVVSFIGSFTYNNTIQIDFRKQETKQIEFEADDFWIAATTKEFWIHFMTKIYE